jgi:hypothetical protein
MNYLDHLDRFLRNKGLSRQDDQLEEILTTLMKQRTRPPIFPEVQQIGP